MTVEEKLDRVLEILVVLKADVRKIKAKLAGQENRMDRRFRDKDKRRGEAQHLGSVRARVGRARPRTPKHLAVRGAARAGVGHPPKRLGQ